MPSLLPPTPQTPWSPAVSPEEALLHPPGIHWRVPNDNPFFLGTHYTLDPDAPIDVVIPCARKDAGLLNLCIAAIRQHGERVRNVYVLSEESWTDQATWVDESIFPFTLEDLAIEIFGNATRAQEAIASPDSQISWIYQQVLKLYAPFMIPGISSNVLLLDAGTIFLRDVSFLAPDGAALFNVSNEYSPTYFANMERLLPGLQRSFFFYSGMANHMLVQLPVLEDLFALIAEQHQTEIWKAFCHAIDPHEVGRSCMSEYEIYFNFAFSRSDQFYLRPLKWQESLPRTDWLLRYREEGFDYVSLQPRTQPNIQIVPPR